MPLLCKRVRSHKFIKNSRIRHIFIYLCESWIRDQAKYFACANFFAGYSCSFCLPIGTLQGFIWHDSGVREHCAFDEQADAVTTQLDFERT
jgi:hypothetical protein